MIEENIKIHDRYKFEIKFNYPLEEGQTKYEIDSYLFFPKTLKINDIFTHKSFYDSIQSYIRFKTPTLLLKDIASETGFIQVLHEKFESLAKEFTKKKRKKFERSIKTYGAVCKSSFREHVDLIEKKTDAEDITFIIHEYIKHSQKILDNYRKLRFLITVPTINEETFSIFRYGDEYLSLLFNKYNYKILEYLKLHDELYAKLSNKLLHLIENEIAYRREHLKINIHEEGDNSLFLYKASNLKKYISSPLFLDTRTHKAGTWVTQFVYAFAAGLSMIFATLVAFNAQQFFGNFTMPLFVALVVSYIFKDRIKDLVKFYYNKKFSKRFFDYKTTIKDGYKKIGLANERAFLLDYKYLSEDIIKARVPKQFKIIYSGVDAEDIIYYQKKIKIYSSAINEQLSHLKLDGINDIIRFDVSNYLKNMDNPNKKIFLFKDKDYSKIKAKRVYHINLVIIYKDAKKNKVYRRFRIVLTRKGILDIVDRDNRSEEKKLLP